MTFSRRSSLVIRPISYWDCTSATSLSVCSRIPSFSGGASTSFFEMVIPALLA
jgi:hypothetical protein